MSDEIFDRNYQAGRADLKAGIDRAVNRIAEQVGKSFEVLHRIQWSAPWARQSARDPGCA